ncbi:MAG: hypothetical protein J6J43_08365 [Oscillospiraceae bacterium]|nr:hypothetical protein [Oscillospiraceae bacterium]
MKIRFNRPAWQDMLTTAYSFRFTETPSFTQKEDHITTCVNASHREGFDNISLLSKQTYTAGAKATIRCAFEDLGCPEIIIVPEAEACADGAVRYGACFEVVLWKNGINVWRHYREDGKCFWHKRLGMSFSNEEHKIHALTVQVLEQELLIDLNGQKTSLRAEDLPERFHLGLTGCEGIVRIYEMSIEA